MNKKKLLILLGVIAVVVVFVVFNNKEEVVLDFDNVVIDENGCGSVTQSDIINKLDDQDRKISNLSGIEEYDILGCSSYKFTLDTGETVVVTDKGDYEINIE